MTALRDKALTLRPALAGTLARSLWPLLAVIAAATVIQLLVRPNIEPYPANLLLTIGINIVLAVSLTMVNGFTGQFSMGHAGFMAVGGYAAGTVTYYFSLRHWGSADSRAGVLSGMLGGDDLAWLTSGDMLFLFSLLVGGLVSAVFGVLVGLPSLRLRGDYLAIVTLGFGEIVRVMIQQTGPVIPTAELAAQTPVWKLPGYVGGSLGFSGIPTYTGLFWAYLFVGITGIVAFRLKRSTFGRAFLSIREDEIAAEAMGVNTTRYKVWAFVIAAFFAGIAGGLFAHTLGIGLSAEAAGFMKSFDIIIMVVLGGLGSISGAALAAVIVTLLPEAFRDPVGFVETPWGMAVAGILILVALGGLVARARQCQPLTRAIVMRVVIFSLLGLGFWAAKRGFDLGQYRMIVYALALILIMIFRPQGLLGVNEIWDKAAWAWAKGRKMPPGPEHATRTISGHPGAST